MPLLTPSAVHIDQPLSNLTLAYVQEQTNFIADKVFPTIGVQRQSDKFYKYDRANMNRAGDVKKLAPRTEVNRIGMEISNDSYFADVYGLGMTSMSKLLLTKTQCWKSVLLALKH
jgi:hypothetical protein